ncbi:MAG TPA: DUF4157 domain-containing protein [Pyrinomonadaceae bacterium]|nr:DUF4157 domain-containing protein [Pyrinomonadaceae bacterium]
MKSAVTAEKRRELEAAAERAKRPASPSQQTGPGAGAGMPMFLQPSVSPSQARPVIQAKLPVNQPGDVHEQEADRVSEQLTNSDEPQSQRAVTNDRQPDGQSQTKQAPANNSVETAASPVIHEALHSSGQPLDSSTREFFEPRFGHDLSRVRVHSSPAADQMAESVGARAFTLGSDIVFGRGEYAPATAEGRRLLAHELVHTKQQRPDTIYRKIRVGGVEIKAKTLLPPVTNDVNTWYTGIVTTMTTQVGASFVMPFTQAEAVARAGEILQEMENAKFEKWTQGHNKSGFEYKYNKEDYYFDFVSAQDASNEVLFRLSLMLNMSLANRRDTAYARYRNQGEEGLSLQGSTTWQSIPAQTEFKPGGFQLQPGTTPSAAITQLTAPVADVQQRIVVDCSTLMGILYYKSLLEASGSAEFDKKFQNKMIVGPLEALYGDKKNTFHPLKTKDNPADSPYMKQVTISKLEDLVPGDTVMFENHSDYKPLASGGLWSGEYAVYTRKAGGKLFFEGFGLAETSYDKIIQTLQDEYAAARSAAGRPVQGPVPFEETVHTIGGKRPGIKTAIFRIDLAAYEK